MAEARVLRMAGELVLAAADGDVGKVVGLLEEATEHGERTGLELILQVAAVASTALEGRWGGEWRARMSAALLELQLDGDTLD
ncbi:hypothetical protein [Leifsonia aquatica]|uniref:hypothetical protein n=1 Tax=Leifsonia aquatica TaxID=144185 RepID=UPI0038288A7D